MARLVVKSPYIKGGSGASNYIKYIGTRERVQIIADDRPPTRRQEQLIGNILRDFPDSRQLCEYEEYETAQTKHAASAFISSALESNWDQASHSEIYMQYIATRPRTERMGAHGLFGDEDHVDLDAAMKEVTEYPGNIWTHIISLKREDAARLGYDHAEAWRDLLRTHRNDIAAAMHIPPDDFRWYAAFHDESDHPHVHMMAWSIQPGQAYLTTEGIRQIKSELTNDIFKQEMLHLYEQKSEQRDELVRKARQEMRRLVREMQQTVCGDPAIEELMSELSQQLGTVKGKKSYGYLPKTMKPLIDQIVDTMEKLPVVDACYGRWWELQCQVMDFYSVQDRPRPPLSQQKEFRSIKNAVIREVENIRLGKITFEDAGMAQQAEGHREREMPREVLDPWDVIHDDRLPLDERDSAVEGLRYLAEAGDLNAQYLMGQLCRDGPVVFPDWYESCQWFHWAATQDHAPSQYALVSLLLSDDPEIRDVQTGLYWLTRAAQNGDPYAAYRLGKEYLRGTVAEKDISRAVDYLIQAAEVGNSYAQYALGKLYLSGQGTPPDREAAVYWLTRSAGQGHPYARLLLDRQAQGTAPAVALSLTRLLHHMSRIFRDNLPSPSSTGIQVDRKLRQKIREKKIAAGHREDDHEEYQGPTMSM